jgi:hypothetical protein
MKIHTFAMAILVSVGPAAAQESTFTVDKLQRLCEGYFLFPKDVNASFPCMTYVEGVTDGFLHAGYFGCSICPPKSIRLPTMISTIFDDQRNDPMPKDTQAPTLVFRALMRAYPCKR